MLDCLLYISKRLHTLSVTEHIIRPQWTKIYRSTRIDVETNICCTKEDNLSTCMIPATLINSSSSHSSYIYTSTGPIEAHYRHTTENNEDILYVSSMNSGACDRATSLWSHSFITVTVTPPWIKNQINHKSVDIPPHGAATGWFNFHSG